jgi:hypothetical protein
MNITLFSEYSISNINNIQYISNIHYQISNVNNINSINKINNINYQIFNINKINNMNKFNTCYLQRGRLSKEIEKECERWSLLRKRESTKGRGGVEGEQREGEMEFVPKFHVVVARVAQVSKCLVTCKLLAR